jgi:hypothetical protein
MVQANIYLNVGLAAMEKVILISQMILALCPHYSRSFKAWVLFKPEQYPFVLSTN